MTNNRWLTAIPVLLAVTAATAQGGDDGHT